MTLKDAAKEVFVADQNAEALTYDQFQEYGHDLVNQLGALAERHTEYLICRAEYNNFRFMALDYPDNPEAESESGSWLALNWLNRELKIKMETARGAAYRDGRMTQKGSEPDLLPSRGAPIDVKVFDFKDRGELEKTIVRWIRANAHYSVSRELFPETRAPGADLPAAAKDPS